MLKKVRKKFIIVAVTSVLLVLFCILGTINLVNYIGVTRNADELIDILKEGGGGFGVPPFPNFSPETPYSTRYFTVTMSDTGYVVDMNLNRIASVSVEDAVACASELFSANRTGGFYGNFRYGTMSLRGDNTMYIFVDCSAELSNFRDFLFASLGIGIAGVAVVFILILIFSGRIMKPVAESYRKQKQFITDAGHEIKTPLTIIGANTEVIEIQSGESEWTKGIKEQIARLTSLTEKLIFLARMEEQSKIIMFEFSLSDAVRESVQPFAAVAAANGVTLKAEVQDGVSYTGNEEMLRRLVALLVDNALKYTDGGEIGITLRAEGNRKIIETRNRASYIEDGDLSPLFGRFTRGDASRNSGTGGHGIGLSVVSAIVEAHKGKLKAECKDGTAIFTIIL